jgi:hypothetical protein
MIVDNLEKIVRNACARRHLREMSGVNRTVWEMKEIQILWRRRLNRLSHRVRSHGWSRDPNQRQRHQELRHLQNRGKHQKRSLGGKLRRAPNHNERIDHRVTIRRRAMIRRRDRIHQNPIDPIGLIDQRSRGGTQTEQEQHAAAGNPCSCNLHLLLVFCAFVRWLDLHPWQPAHVAVDNRIRLTDLRRTHSLVEPRSIRIR